MATGKRFHRRGGRPVGDHEDKSALVARFSRTRPRLASRRIRCTARCASAFPPAPASSGRLLYFCGSSGSLCAGRGGGAPFRALLESSSPPGGRAARDFCGGARTPFLSRRSFFAHAGRVTSVSRLDLLRRSEDGPRAGRGFAAGAGFRRPGGISEYTVAPLALCWHSGWRPVRSRRLAIALAARCAPRLMLFYTRPPSALPSRFLGPEPIRLCRARPAGAFGREAEPRVSWLTRDPSRGSALLAFLCSFRVERWWRPEGPGGLFARPCLSFFRAPDRLSTGTGAVLWQPLSPARRFLRRPSDRPAPRARFARAVPRRPRCSRSPRTSC